jgi:hypothetical protein
MKNFKVLSTAKIDGGAYRWLEIADGSWRIEEWRAGKWEPGGADIDEFWYTPPVSTAFAAGLGIPLSDITTAPPRLPAPADAMSPTAKSENLKVLDTGHIDGGAYRWVELADGSGRVENWGPKGWAPGGASIGEIADAPPVSERFAAKFGIPMSDLTTPPTPRPPARSETKLTDKQMRQAISLGAKMAEANALLMLAMKARQLAELDRRRRGLRLVWDRDQIAPRQA